MQAIIYLGNQQLALREVNPPIPGPQEVKLRVCYSGICGSDLHEYLLGPIIIQPNCIPGHEFSGEIVELGQGISNWKIGQQVTVNPIRSCRQCNWCAQGLYNLCARSQVIGYTRNGALAEYVCVDASQLHQIPQNVSLEEAALTEPFSCALHALKQARLEDKQSIVVLGLGPIGLCLIQLAKAQGVGPILAVGKHAIGKEMANKCGATAVFDYKDDKLVEKIFQLTGGRGADVTFECAGREAALEAALNSVRKGGKVILEGMLLEGAPRMNFVSLVFQEKQLIGSLAYTNEFPTVLTLMQKKLINPQWLISRRIGLPQAIENGYQELLQHKSSYLKIIVSPG